MGGWVGAIDAAVGRDNATRRARSRRGIHFAQPRSEAHTARISGSKLTVSALRRFHRGLAVVARRAQRLKVAPVEARTTVLDRHDVIHDASGDGQSSRRAMRAQRMRPQISRATLLPGSRFIEPQFRIEGAASATVITMLPAAMRGAITRRREHCGTSWKPAGCRCASRHYSFRLAS